MPYARNAVDLHRYGRHPQTFEALSKAASLEPLKPIDIEKLSSERQRVVETVSRMSRAANFREQVLNGYGHRCAVTRMQLRLVDAAHILPVAVPGSADHIINGPALSPTYHRAFDNGLIYLTESHAMRINPEKEAKLATLNLEDGIEAFKKSLGKIHLPADRRQWPDPRFIRKANRFRRISAA
ncbi:MAG: HNH endonuclease [Planctomycetes bacterium]|nr:HNH endonuclease [Planctomycetota bacterium]